MAIQGFKDNLPSIVQAGDQFIDSFVNYADAFTKNSNRRLNNLVKNKKSHPFLDWLQELYLKRKLNTAHKKNLSQINKFSHSVADVVPKSFSDIGNFKTALEACVHIEKGLKLSGDHKESITQRFIENNKMITLFYNGCRFNPVEIVKKDVHFFGEKGFYGTQEWPYSKVKDDILVAVENYDLICGTKHLKKIQPSQDRSFLVPVSL